MKPFQKFVIWIMEEAEYTPKIFFWILGLVFVGFPLIAFLGSVLAWGLAAPP
jgi:hypothetical protein